MANEDSQQCCLVENNRRCRNRATNAIFAKRLQKTLGRRFNISVHEAAGHNSLCAGCKSKIQRFKKELQAEEEANQQAAAAGASAGAAAAAGGPPPVASAGYGPGGYPGSEDGERGGGMPLPYDAQRGGIPASALHEAASAVAAGGRYPADTGPLIEPDFSVLGVAALKRYKRHYRLPTRHNMPKLDLVSHIMDHFRHQHGSVEPDVLDQFIETVKKGNNRLDRGEGVGAAGS
eukprot:Clim_evm67s77 gene=Clim_evmTU67s77